MKAERIRRKMKRWKIEGPPKESAPAFVACRVERHLKQLSNLVAPRVHAAVLSTIFNRWTTARRFQRRGCISNQCWLGCDAGCEDSIEHYAKCPTLRDFSIAVFSMREIDLDIGIFTMAVTTCGLPDMLTKIAILVYAAYTVTNSNRARGERPVRKDYAMDALKQASINAVAGHSKSMKVLDNVFSHNSNKRRRR